MWRKILFLCGVIGFVMSRPINKPYKTVVVIHGINDTPQRLKFFADVISKIHPGTNVTIIDSFNGKLSLLPLWMQIDKIRDTIREICLSNPQGIHLIGYSQGGLIARGVLQTMDDHNIDTFISLVSPQNGQYGETDQQTWLKGWVKENLYKFLYSALGQLISVGGYWKDPHHVLEYCGKCHFLPVLNNKINHSQSERFKKNFLKLKKAVFIASSNDTTITPWQSSRFGFYDKDEQVIEMKDQETYQQDSFGLRSMDERGDLILDTISGLDHKDLPDNEPFIENHIIPWLT